MGRSGNLLDLSQSSLLRDPPRGRNGRMKGTGYMSSPLHRRNSRSVTDGLGHDGPATPEINRIMTSQKELGAWQARPFAR